MSHVIGIDTSTTATKALVIDAAGRVVAQGASEYEYDAPRPQWAEQHPDLWWHATVASIRTALESSDVGPEDVEAIGLTGQMHGSALVDGGGDAVRPALLWNDQRTGAECDEIRQRVGRERLISITGNDAMTGFTAPKLLWVRNQEPATWNRVSTVLLPKDFVRLRLTGERAVDVADGSGTGLFDISDRGWSNEILDALDLDGGLFPAVFEGPTVTGAVSREAASATGLLAGTPVVAGGGDQSANAVGVGVIDPGTTALSLGTSGVVFAATDEPLVEPAGRVHAFCHAVPGRWHMMGVMLSAAGSLRWFRDTVAPEVPFDDLVATAVDIPPGSEGLVFLPYLTGERTPHADPTARGAFIGLTVRHGLGHLTRSVLEGVAFGLRQGLDLMVSAGMPRPASMRASGGGIASALWRQILADVLGVTIETTSTREGAAFGAGILAMVGAGLFSDVGTATAQLIQTRHAASPSDSAPRYEHAYANYAALYPALAPLFQSIGE